jgi:hypothetical protein
MQTSDARAPGFLPLRSAFCVNHGIAHCVRSLRRMTLENPTEVLDSFLNLSI